MEKCKIILADSDLSYLSAIELLLLREYGNQIDLQLVTEGSCLDTLFREPRRIDILVINESLWQENFRRQDIRQVFLLSEEEHPRVRTEDNDILLYKYTSAREIFASINIVLRRFIGVRTQAASRLVMLYSPQGGSGKTTLAMGICSGLASLGSRVLFLNAEPLQSPNIFLPEDDAFFSDTLLKQILTNSIQTDALQVCIAKGDFDYLLPMRYAMTSCGMTEEHFFRLVPAAAALGYDFIVVDCSCDFTAAKTQLMKSASYVVLPFRGDQSGQARYRRLRESLSVDDHDKFIFVQNQIQELPVVPDLFRPDLILRHIPALRENTPAALYKLQADGAFTELIYRFL